MQRACPCAQATIQLGGMTFWYPSFLISKKKIKIKIKIEDIEIWILSHTHKKIVDFDLRHPSSENY